MPDLRQVSFTIEDIRHALTHPLPGSTGQIEMAPAPIGPQTNRWKIPGNCREAGVLLLFYPRNSNGCGSKLYLTLTRRHEYPGVHSGQISLPGGRREAGETLETTALRETREEIGVSPEKLEVMGQLSALYTPPSNFCIYPFVAFSPIRPAFQPDPREVAELIEVPLEILVDPTIRKEETWHFDHHGKRQIPFFDIYGHKVWGATAMILSEFLMLLNN